MIQGLQEEEDCSHSYVVFDDISCDVICCDCGLVVENFWYGEFIQARGSRGSPSYAKKNNYNQIMLAWANECKAIPRDLLLYILPHVFKQKTDRGYKSFKELTKRDMLRVLGSVILTDELALKYSSVRTHKPLKKLSERKQYSLRWFLFKYYYMDKIDDIKPDYYTISMASKLLRTLYTYIISNFRYVRHKDGCGGKGKCHKSFGCRYAAPNTSCTTRLLLSLIGVLNDDYKSDFAIPKRFDKSIELLTRIILRYDNLHTFINTLATIAADTIGPSECLNYLEKSINTTPNIKDYNELYIFILNKIL